MTHTLNSMCRSLPISNKGFMESLIVTRKLLEGKDGLPRGSEETSPYGF